MNDLGLTPAEYARGERRRQGGIPQTGHTQARRARLDGAWASRDPAQLRRHRLLRLAQLPKPSQEVRGNAQGRLWKR
jgi:hypothetical protein